MFSYHLRWMSHVKRWGIAPTIRSQYLDGHSYFVILYTSELCTMFGKPLEFRMRAIEYAIRHDSAELLTSDVPGPSKRHFVDGKRLEEFEQKVNERNGPDFVKRAGYGKADREIKDFVKVADLIDEVMFLHQEILMGNNHLIYDLYRNSCERLDAAAKKIGDNENKVYNEVKAQRDLMLAHGVQFLENNSDLT